MTAATQPATPAAPNNNEPVRVNHTARNVIITIVVVAIIAVGMHRLPRLNLQPQPAGSIFFYLT